MVREERLELSHLAAPEPKSGVSTNSTTPALSLVLHLEEMVAYIVWTKSLPQSILHLEGMVAMAGLEPATPAL